MALNLRVGFSCYELKRILNPSEFTAKSNCTLALAKNDACTVSVTFTPPAKGKKSATLNIASNDPKKATATVKLSGAGK